MTDNVNHPTHYATGWTNGAEIIDITENLNFNRGNVIKYVARAGNKHASDEMEDLLKAKWYLEREIRRVERQLTDSTTEGNREIRCSSMDLDPRR